MEQALYLAVQVGSFCLPIIFFYQLLSGIFAHELPFGDATLEFPKKKAVAMLLGAMLIILCTGRIWAGSTFWGNKLGLFGEIDMFPADWTKVISHIFIIVAYCCGIIALTPIKERKILWWVAGAVFMCSVLVFIGALNV